MTKSLLGKKTDNPLPDHISAYDLANQFNNFYSDKVQAIRDDIEKATNKVNIPPDGSRDNNPTRANSNKLSSYKTVTQEDIEKLITKSASKSCELDPIPTWLLKHCLEPLLPLITRIINTSIEEAVVPDKFKIAHIRPLLKKKNLDKQILKKLPASLKSALPLENPGKSCGRTIQETCVSKQSDGKHAISLQTMPLHRNSPT